MRVSTMRRRALPTGLRRSVAASVCAASAVAAVGIGAPASADAGVLSYSQPHRVTPSTGNLYWTAGPGNDALGQVWRASKQNAPGQETLLYQEQHKYPTDFEAITWAFVNGQYYGYFVANYPTLNRSVIKRVPLSGGQAVTVAQSPAYVGNRDLVNDGTYLYWADKKGIRRVKIGGGTVKTLVSGTSFSHVGLDATQVFYTSGPDIDTIPKTGGAPSLWVSDNATITAMSVDATDEVVRYGDADGAVMQYPWVYPGVFYYQDPGQGETITSVALGDSIVYWGECGGAGCRIGWYQNAGQGSWATNGAPVDISADAAGAYYGDDELESYPLS
ncbi:MAG TPA: hypothetical protein VGL69_16080 [Solirubrobacteraceae bacterium]